MVASSAWSIAMCSTNGFGQRAAQAGAIRRTGLFKRFERDAAGLTVVHYDERATDGSVTAKAVQDACTDRRRRGAIGGRTAVPARRRSATLCVCLSRDRPLATGGFQFRWHTLRRLLSRLPCRRIFTVGYFPMATRSASAPVRHARDFPCAIPLVGSATRQGWVVPKPFAAKARRSRCIHCRVGTMDIAFCSLAMPPVWWRRRPGRGFTTP